MLSMEEAMRQIKFRAWWVEEKKMLHNAQNFYDGLNRRDNGNEYEPVQSFAEILESPDSYIAMQFTGLLDREGVEVFEGDVVKAHYFYFNGNFDNDGEIIGVVRYSDWCAWGIGVVSGGGCSEWFDFLDTSHFEEPCIEVIGNIHQNPELLK